MRGTRRSSGPSRPTVRAGRGGPQALVALAVLLALALVGGIIWSFRSAPPAPTAADSPSSASAVYVGSQRCAACHAQPSREWRDSQHAAAMAEATDATVKGRFDGATLSYAGTTSTFYRRDGKFYATTDGADGKLTEFEVAYTFGVAPLQQYLIKFPGGRLQALSTVWDTRPVAEGGQRWMHLYPRDSIRAGDPLHWTGPQQNWNFMCADCHSTNVVKGYDATTRTFQTTWSEISVGCEACHGPGSEHVSRAETGGGWGSGYGLTARLDERRTARWAWDETAAAPIRSGPGVNGRETDVCARCHSRRTQVTDRWQAGDVLEDGFRPAAVEALLFHPDGQQRDEVYTHTSFLESRMHAKGVTCSDCHNPHSGALRTPGNGTCTQCHASARYDAAAHHLHRAGTAAAACVTCHMPTATYMVIDPRHDHSFRVPRPDRAAALGVPDTCTSSCHTNRNGAWAAAELVRRGRVAGGSQSFAEAFAAFDLGDTSARRALATLAADVAQPSVVRAGALSRIAASGPEADAGLPLRALLTDSAPMVRRAALDVLRQSDDAIRIQLAPMLLTDAVRTVRIEAARALVDIADRSLSGTTLAGFEQAFRELVAEHQFNADRPEAQVSLGLAWMSRGRRDDARAAFREAIALDRTFVPAYVNLAEVYRVEGDETAAERSLRDALGLNASNADVHHALGLSLVRQKRYDQALPALREAVRLSPNAARYGYVLGVALHDRGHREEALRVLRDTHRRQPADRDLLQALALYSEQAGRLTDARTYAERLLALEPGNAAYRSLVERLAGR